MNVSLGQQCAGRRSAEHRIGPVLCWSNLLQEPRAPATPVQLQQHQQQLLLQHQLLQQQLIMQAAVCGGTSGLYESVILQGTASKGRKQGRRHKRKGDVAVNSGEEGIKQAKLDGTSVMTGESNRLCRSDKQRRIINPYTGELEAFDDVELDVGRRSFANNESGVGQTFSSSVWYASVEECD